jgi:luciferase family oxidoreductase group 1
MTSLQLGALDFCRVTPGSRHADAIWDTIELAKNLDTLGYSRYWLGEHHVAGIAHSSPEVLIPALAGVTSQIRIGSAGILLRFYSPFKVAKTFRLLQALFPGRIDLGIAKGSAPEKVRDLLLDFQQERQYEDKVRELLNYMRGTADIAPNPIGVAPPEIWILGSSGKSNLLAAVSGTSLCLSLFLDPHSDWALGSLDQYRAHFVPVDGVSAPQWGIAVAGICAENDHTANRLLQEFIAGNESKSSAVHVFPTVVGGPASCFDALAALSYKYETSSIIFLDLCRRFEDRLRSYYLLSLQARGSISTPAWPLTPSQKS